jgi:hypothetical protein
LTLEQLDVYVFYFDEVAADEFGALAQLYFSISKDATFVNYGFGVATGFGYAECLE